MAIVGGECGSRAVFASAPVTLLTGYNLQKVLNARKICVRNKESLPSPLLPRSAHSGQLIAPRPFKRAVVLPESLLHPSTQRRDCAAHTRGSSRAATAARSSACTRPATAAALYHRPDRRCPPAYGVIVRN